MVRVAVNEAYELAEAGADAMADALVGVYFTVPGIAVPAFRKVTVPDGAKPMLAESTSAVRVTLALGWTVLTHDVWTAAGARCEGGDSGGGLSDGNRCGA